VLARLAARPPLARLAAALSAHSAPSRARQPAPGAGSSAAAAAELVAWDAPEARPLELADAPAEGASHRAARGCAVSAGCARGCSRPAFASKCASARVSAAASASAACSVQPVSTTARL
jgi:hypothetical protein